jgi:S-adenosylmethionine:tRNA ribosyltransferase-isomerase
MHLDAFSFDLPPELIAQAPLCRRSASRLLHLDGVTGALRDLTFDQLPDQLEPGDVLVLNDTRVVKARLYGRKPSGGKIEVLVERVLDASSVLAMLRASHAPTPGSALEVAGIPTMVVERRGDLFVLRFTSSHSAWDIMERFGSVPLPPYIGRSPGAEDEERYQTVYARNAGAVAAPTAGLHFDRALLQRIHGKGIEIVYVTLHVGAGTFLPMRTADIDEHRMHSECYDVPAATVDAIERASRNGGRIVAVGTTTLRALEAAAVQSGFRAGVGETDLFIRPGYRFRVVDRLITNFHLPRSTLLMLVCAFAGTDRTLSAYRHAVAQRYRFFSYGDAMLVDPAQPREVRSSSFSSCGTSAA